MALAAAGEGDEEEEGEEGEERDEVEEVESRKALPTKATTLASSSPSSFLELPEPLPASAPLCYYALPRDPDDEGVGAERVVMRKKK